jgi:hypothetical protein
MDCTVGYLQMPAELQGVSTNNCTECAMKEQVKITGWGETTMPEFGGQRLGQDLD